MTKSFFRLIANLTVAGMSLLIFGGLAVVMVYYHFSQDLPDYSQLEKYDPPIVTRLYASDGRLMAEYATEKRVYVPLTAIPRQVREAFIAAEDKNFYEHTGVDFFGIVRALRDNLSNYAHKRSLSGGSTITQQVVKNFLLTNEQSITRKIKEAILAFRLSQVYSKDRILELYLNEIYLGQGSYGVAAAALNYFNKPLDELSVEEAAYLAALPKAPANYDPIRHYDRAKERRDWVVARMMEDNYISEEQALAAQKAPIMLRRRDVTEIARADFFAEEVRRTLATMYGSSVLYEGGLWVKTTLDPKLQNFADDALRFALMEYDRRKGWRGPVARIDVRGDWKAALERISPDQAQIVDGQKLAMVSRLSKDAARIGFSDGAIGTIPLSELKWARRVIPGRGLAPEVQKPADVLAEGDVVIVRRLPGDKGEKDQFTLQQVPLVNGAMVAMDPHTGRVLAMAGGYSYGKTEFNRATQAKRQPGSSFKPFVYLTGLENGFQPTSIIMDAPVALSQGAGLPNWTPKNYGGDYLGPATMRTGLEKSRNAMTVRMATALGVDRVIAVAKRFGIYDDVPRNFSIVLGAAETTLLRLVTAYCMIDNGGLRVSPALIERIDDRNGHTIFRRDTRECKGCNLANADSTLDAAMPPVLADNRERVADERVAYQMVSMLQGVVDRGTATRARAVGKPLAGKTGTTNDSRDVWFVGFSPDLVAGIYVGYDTPKSLGPKETGGSVAVPGFVNFMTNALKDIPARPFPVPPGIHLARVDPHSGFPASEGGILEAFRDGDDLYLPPGAYGDLPRIGENGDASGDVVIPAEGEGEGAAPLFPERTAPPAPSAPVVGTGGLY